MIESQANEITLLYHSDKEDDLKMKAYLETLEIVGVKTFDLKTERLSNQDLSDIAEKLDVDITELFEPVNKKKRSKEEAMKLLVQNPILLSTPIIIIGEHAYQFESSPGFIQEAQQYRRSDTNR